MATSASLGGSAVTKRGLRGLVAAIEGDALKEDNVKMQMQIHATAEALDKRDRSRLHLVPLDAAFDRLVDITLRDRGTDRGMHLRHQVT
jgi:hypothetical protein